MSQRKKETERELCLISLSYANKKRFMIINELTCDD